MAAGMDEILVMPVNAVDLWSAIDRSCEKPDRR